MLAHKVALPPWLGARAPRTVQALAILLTMAGIGVWSSILLAPRPTAAPPVLAIEPPSGQDISPISNWFGGGSARVRIAVVGLISSGRQGSALLSINGQAPASYRVGQALAQGVTLASVNTLGVSIDQDGIIEEVFVQQAGPPVQGFVPVSSAP